METVKLADDGRGDVVVRLHGAGGGRACAVPAAGFPITAVHEIDVLEDPLTAHPPREGRIELTLRPFQILTLRVTPTSFPEPPCD